MSNSTYWETRIQNIHDGVSLRDLIDYFNVPCQSTGEITQLHCPFHGNDRHASARIYETNTMYCWVCSKSWDVIGFVKDFKHIEFAAACTFLEELYNIEKTDKSIAYHEESFKDYLKSHEVVKEKNFDGDFSKISKILIKNRSSYTMDEYVKYFYFLDTLYINYMSNKHDSDQDLERSLQNLFTEISAN